MPLLLGRGHWLNVDTPSGAIEADLTVDESENCVISAQPDVFTRNEFRSSLADYDIAGSDRFASKFLHAETFADAITAVFNAALSFFMVS